MKAMVLWLGLPLWLTAACSEDSSRHDGAGGDGSAPPTDGLGGTTSGDADAGTGFDADTGAEVDAGADVGTAADADTGTSVDADTDADTDSGMDPSSGCGLAPPESGSYGIVANGESREYILDVPPAYDANTPYPIVFGFHGMGTDGELFRAPFYSDLPAVMANEAILVFPTALGEPTRWELDRDIPYFDELLAYLKTVLCVDANRVFATGHSSGGGMTNDLGCQRGDVLRAIAPVAGAGPYVFGGASCAGQVAAWITHADNDESVDFSSGKASRDHWIEANGCNPEDSTTVTAPECVAYNGCDSGYPVHWCVHHDNHNWPDFATQAMWDFFNSL